MEDNTRKSFFLNAISHDLRTPLNAISLQTELAQAFLQHGELEAANEAIIDIRNNTKDVASLLGSLLEYARMELATETGEPESFDLRQFVEHLIKAFNLAALRKGLYIKACGQPLTIVANRLKLFRVLTNLIDNAIKFTDTGGVTISILPTSSAVAIIVEDTGPGISESFRKSLFQEFVQCNNIERDRSKGLGLGLAMTRKLVVQLAGDINVSSNDSGSRFIISLPIDITQGPDCRGQPVNQGGPATIIQIPGDMPIGSFDPCRGHTIAQG